MFASTFAVPSIVLGANAIAVPDASADASPAADLWNSLAKREAEAEARNRWELVWPNFCSGFVGRICGKAKRDASPEAEAVCGADRQPCAKVRRAASLPPSPTQLPMPGTASAVTGA